MSLCSIPTWKELIALLHAAYEGWMADRAPWLGVSLAFNTRLSLAPIIGVVVAVAGFAFGERAAEGRLVYEIQDLIGPEVAVAEQGLLASARGSETMTFGTLAGLTERHGSVFRRQLEVSPERPDNHIVSTEPPPQEEPVIVIPESFGEQKRRIA